LIFSSRHPPFADDCWISATGHHTQQNDCSDSAESSSGLGKNE
jgi:hypothetical protein